MKTFKLYGDETPKRCVVEINEDGIVFNNKLIKKFYKYDEIIAIDFDEYHNFILYPVFEDMDTILGAIREKIKIFTDIDYKLDIADFVFNKIKEKRLKHYHDLTGEDSIPDANFTVFNCTLSSFKIKNVYFYYTKLGFSKSLHIETEIGNFRIKGLNDYSLITVYCYANKTQYEFMGKYYSENENYLRKILNMPPLPSPLSMHESKNVLKEYGISDSLITGCKVYDGLDIGIGENQHMTMFLHNDILYFCEGLYFEDNNIDLDYILKKSMFINCSAITNITYEKERIFDEDEYNKMKDLKKGIEEVVNWEMPEITVGKPKNKKVDVGGFIVGGMLGGTAGAVLGGMPSKEENEHHKQKQWKTKDDINLDKENFISLQRVLNIEFVDSIFEKNIKLIDVPEDKIVTFFSDYLNKKR